MRLGVFPKMFVFDNCFNKNYLPQNSHTVAFEKTILPRYVHHKMHAVELIDFVKTIIKDKRFRKNAVAHTVLSHGPTQLTTVG